MRLTQHSDYALRTLMYLGLQPAGKLATIQEIADAYAISKNHLMKVVGKLAGHSYVLSTRGAGGGIRLAKSPEDIVIGDVLRKMEPADGMVECLRADNQCVVTPACVLPRILAQAYQAFLHELDQYRLQDLLPESHRPALIQLLGIDSSDPPNPRRSR